jgi:hypothetical protein
MLAMRAAVMPSRRALVRNVALLAAVALVASWALLATADDAHAMSGRRLCVYVNGQRVPSEGLTRYVVDNDEKDGKCPYVNPNKYSGLIINRNPVPKLTCEQVSADFEYDSKYHSDICGLLNKETMYVLQKLDKRPFDPNSDIFNLGSIKYFR